MENDSIPIILPSAGEQVVLYDVSTAVNAGYDDSGIDLAALRQQVPSTWLDGIEATPRNVNAGDDSGVLAIITGMTVLMMLSYKHCRRLFATLFDELLGMRHRANVFDEHTTNETQVLVLMALQWSVYTGLLLYSYLSSSATLAPRDTFIDTVKLIGLMAGYYVFQLLAYSTVGYTFSTPEGRRYFVQGFTSSQSLLGFMLIIPALVSIFYPVAAPAMITVSVGLYVLARFVFIVKGFRIFYRKISSLLYFILYLCTLEIIPLIVLYSFALSLVYSD